MIAMQETQQSNCACAVSRGPEVGELSSDGVRCVLLTICKMDSLQLDCSIGLKSSIGHSSDGVLVGLLPREKGRIQYRADAVVMLC